MQLICKSSSGREKRFNLFQLQQTQEGLALASRLLSQGRSERAKIRLESITHLQEAISFAKRLYVRCQLHSEEKDNLFFEDDLTEHGLCEKCNERAFMNNRNRRLGVE